MIKFLLNWFSERRLLFDGFSKIVGSLTAIFGNPAKRLLVAWEHLTHFHRNIVVGAGIAIFIAIFHHHAFISDMEDKAMDWMMNMNQSLSRLSGINVENTQISGYVFIDIDQKTYQQWEEPFHTPRDKLLSLIQFAATQAKVIVVDIELTKKGIDLKADKALTKYLKSYGNSEYADLVLIRNIYPDGNRLKPLFFSVKDLDKKIYFGLPLFKIASDLHIRRWLLSGEVCDNGQPTRLPSVQLLVDMIAQKARPEQIDVIRNTLLQNDCNDAITNAHQKPAHDTDSYNLDSVVQYNDRVIDLEVHGIGERLIYTIPWMGQSVDYEHIPARYILNAKQPSYEFLKNKVVVIGASYAESRDIHPTPLGEMPGALVLVNAIKSLNQWGQIQTPPPWIKYLIEALLIVAMAWVFSRMSSFWGTVVLGGSILIVFVPMSFWLFKAGLWVDFAIPVFGMQLHQLVAGYEEKLILKNERK